MNEILNINFLERGKESFIDYLDVDNLTLKTYKVGIDSFINYLKEAGVKDDQIIKINLEDADYNFESYKELYDYIHYYH